MNERLFGYHSVISLCWLGFICLKPKLPNTYLQICKHFTQKHAATAFAIQTRIGGWILNGGVCYRNIGGRDRKYGILAGNCVVAERQSEASSSKSVRIWNCKREFRWNDEEAVPAWFQWGSIKLPLTSVFLINSPCYSFYCFQACKSMSPFMFPLFPITQPAGITIRESSPTPTREATDSWRISCCYLVNGV